MRTTRTTLALLTLLVPLAVARAAEEKHCGEEADKCARMMAERFRERGWVGISMDYDEEQTRVSIARVFPGSPAEKAGLEEGDILKTLNGIAYSRDNEEALMKEHASFRPGGSAIFSVERNSQQLEIEVHLEEIPEAILAQWIGQHMLESHVAQAETAQDEETDGSP